MPVDEKKCEPAAVLFIDYRDINNRFYTYHSVRCMQEEKKWFAYQCINDESKIDLKLNSSFSIVLQTKRISWQKWKEPRGVFIRGGYTSGGGEIWKYTSPVEK